MRVVLVLALVAGVFAAPSVAAHPVHTDCDTVQDWHEAYLDQLLLMHIEWTPGPAGVEYPVVHMGDPMSGIVCVPLGCATCLVPGHLLAKIQTEG